MQTAIHETRSVKTGEVITRTEEVPDLTAEQLAAEAAAEAALHNRPILAAIAALQTSGQRHVEDISVGLGEVITDGKTPKQRLQAKRAEQAVLRATLK